MVQSILKIFSFSIILCYVTSCGVTDPQPIKLFKDNCASCKMTIADGKFGAELITKKGRVYMFDDIQCLEDFSKNQNEKTSNSIFVYQYEKPTEFMDATKAYYVKHEEIKSPMGGNIAAFATLEEAEKLASKLHSESPKTWHDIFSP